jgi:hypothetical protein
VLLDFGADHSFKTAVEKVQRHYGVNVSESTTRTDVYKHADVMQKSDYALSGKPSPEAETIIIQADGGMFPTVCKKDPLFIGDQRKNRMYEWREIRLALAYKQGTVDPIYSAKNGSPDEIGDMIEATAKKAGRHEKTKIYCVSDGATWIAEQIDKKFGNHATYTLDFYHVLKYLAEAAKCCCPEDPNSWFKNQQKNLKNSITPILFADLNSHMTQCNLLENCLALKCYNYLIKRTKQLDYKSAIDAKLPIGSGKVEGGIHSVLQPRLKIAGSWKMDNLQKMAHLRTVAANKKLDAYGCELRSGVFTFS